ncbi:hypothetical protein HanRHA438_Chr09g0416671 [Helianthus annuus]|nr:hypothetical protein HanRHA438_Chr09g0416671 [Helianthus annuus]
MSFFHVLRKKWSIRWWGRIILIYEIIFIKNKNHLITLKIKKTSYNPCHHSTLASNKREKRNKNPHHHGYL